MIVKEVITTNIHTLSPDDTLAVFTRFFCNVKPQLIPLLKRWFRTQLLTGLFLKSSSSFILLKRRRPALLKNLFALVKKKNEFSTTVKFMKNFLIGSCSEGHKKNQSLSLIIFPIFGYHQAAIQHIFVHLQRLKNCKAAVPLAGTKKLSCVTGKLKTADGYLFQPDSLGVFT